MNQYYRNDRLILSNVLTFKPKRRREWRAALAQVGLWLGAATVLGAALYYVCTGVITQ